MRNLFACVAVLASWALPAGAHATPASWPPEERPVQIIAPAPGGMQAGVAIARLVAGHLQQQTGATFSATDTTAVHGQSAADYVGSARPDGGTLLLYDGSLPTTEGGAQSSLTPVCLVALLPNILVVNKSLPVHNLSQFTDYVRLHPGEVNFGSIGHGTALHLAGQLYMEQTGSNMVHVPYTSAALAVSNLMSGQIQSMFQVVPVILQRVQAGDVRPLAVLSGQRVATLPDVPTAAEEGYSALQSGVWLTMMAPAGTPEDVIGNANAALNSMLADEEFRRKLSDMGAVPGGGTVADAARAMQNARARWRTLMRHADPPIR